VVQGWEEMMQFMKRFNSTEAEKLFAILPHAVTLDKWVTFSSSTNIN